MLSLWPAHARRSVVVPIGALVLLAWLTLWAWGESPYGRYLDHRNLDAVRGDAPVFALFIVGWVVMLVAMMLPTSLPLVLLFGGMIQRRANRRQLLGLLLVGYLSVWTVFGLFVHLGDTGIHALVDSQAWLQSRAWLIGAATLLVAGVYQFTPLKYRCLDACRSPLMFITSRWQGRHDQRQAFLLGVHHGLFCLGCCWSLMLLLFGIGMGSLGWMFVLGAVMAAEKNLPWGRRLAAPLGVALVLAGVAVVALAPTTLTI